MSEMSSGSNLGFNMRDIMQPLFVKKWVRELNDPLWFLVVIMLLPQQEQVARAYISDL